MCCSFSFFFFLINHFFGPPFFEFLFYCFPCRINPYGKARSAASFSSSPSLPPVWTDGRHPRFLLRPIPRSIFFTHTSRPRVLLHHIASPPNTRHLAFVQSTIGAIPTPPLIHSFLHHFQSLHRTFLSPIRSSIVLFSYPTSDILIRTAALRCSPPSAVLDVHKNAVDNNEHVARIIKRVL